MLRASALPKAQCIGDGFWHQPRCVAIADAALSFIHGGISPNREVANPFVTWNAQVHDNFTIASGRWHPLVALEFERMLNQRHRTPTDVSIFSRIADHVIVSDGCNKAALLLTRNITTS
jgi:hypothetical protein